MRAGEWIMRRMMRLDRFFILLVVLGSAAGCTSDTFIDPFDSEARYFTLYGYVDEVSREHAFRVIPLQRTVPTIGARETTEQPDAMVRLIDQNTGIESTGRYELARLADDTFGHVFHLTQFIQQGHTYRLEIERSDGVITWAETTVPTVDQEDDVPILASAVEETGGVFTQEITLVGVTSPWDIQVSYFVACDRTIPIRFPYGRVGERVEEGWRFTINLSADTEKVIEQVPFEPNCVDFVATGETRVPPLVSMDVRAMKLDPNWEPPRDEFDPALFASPTAASNVEQGYGFLGAAALYAFPWYVDQDLGVRLGYPRLDDSYDGR